MTPEERLTAIREKLKDVVCTVEPDAGVVLLSQEGPCHYDEAARCQVYDHEYFSELGTALIELFKLAGGEIT